MDVSHMVLPEIKEALRSPALHFAVLGALGLAFLGPGGNTPARVDGIRSAISFGKVALVYNQIAREKGRPLTSEERAEALDIILNREALFLYSREIGLDRDPVVQRRLSQIATFVSENPEETMSEETRVREAVELGLIESDSITRRILIDGARRLIRATALVQIPSEEGMERYLKENPENYQVPGRTRITHVALNRNLRGDQTLRAANEMRKHLIEERLSPEQGAALGDETIVEAALANLTDRSLERRFGTEFSRAVAQLPVGSWEGPIRSPLGQHVVYVHSRTPQRRARLDEVREQVSSDIRNEIADMVLAARVAELREQYDLRVEEPGSS